MKNIKQKKYAREDVRLNWLCISRRRNAQNGFTVFELMITIGIISLLMLGTMDLYVGASRFTMRTQAEVFATYDAGTAMYQLIDQAREAQWLALPGETTPGGSTMFQGLTSYPSVANYQTTDQSRTIETAMMLVFPASRTGASAMTVNLGTGSTTLTGTSAVYDRNLTDDKLLIYRSDANGVPNPSSGTMLWIYSLSDNGATYNRAIIKSIATTPAAVEFVRPTDSSNNILPYQVQIKVISGFYSPIYGHQTNEETNALYTSQLTGMCVLMRDHEQDGSHEPHTGSTTNTIGVGNHWLSE